MTDKEFLRVMVKSWKEYYEGAGSPKSDKVVKALWSAWNRSSEVRSKKKAQKKVKK